MASFNFVNKKTMFNWMLFIFDYSYGNSVFDLFTYEWIVKFARISCSRLAKYSIS